MCTAAAWASAVIAAAAAVAAWASAVIAAAAAVGSEVSV